MRLFRVTSLVICCLLISSAAVAQQPPPQRDTQAIAALQRAVAVMGGAAAIGQVTDCTVSGTVQPSPGSGLISGSFLWKNSGSEFRYQNPGASTSLVYVSGYGRPAISGSGKIFRLFRHVSDAHFPPHLVAVVSLKALQDLRYQLVFAGNETLNGNPVVHIQTSLPVDPLMVKITLQDWYFDLTSGLPVRVAYRLPANHNAEEFRKAAVDLSNFRSVSGVAVPFQIVAYREGRTEGVLTLNSVVFNTGISPTEFNAPTGGGL